jgi:hypothetical protein
MEYLSKYNQKCLNFGIWESISVLIIAVKEIPVLNSLTICF